MLKLVLLALAVLINGAYFRNLIGSLFFQFRKLELPGFSIQLWKINSTNMKFDHTIYLYMYRESERIMFVFLIR